MSPTYFRAPEPMIYGTAVTRAPGVEATIMFKLRAGARHRKVARVSVFGEMKSKRSDTALALLGAPDEVPPADTPLREMSHQMPVSPEEAVRPVPPGVATRTRIATPMGWKPVEELAPGDKVLTRDHGACPVIANSVRTAAEIGLSAPVIFEPGVLGNEARLVVSPRHRLLRTGGWAEILFGVPEVLVPAAHFVDVPGVVRGILKPFTWYNLVMEGHEVIQAEGAWVESLLHEAPACGLSHGAHHETSTDPHPRKPRSVDAARLCLTSTEARALTAEARATARL